MTVLPAIEIAPPAEWWSMLFGLLLVVSNRC